jgi:endonuclease III
MRKNRSLQEREEHGQATRLICTGMEKDIADLQSKALEVHGRLCRAYGCPVKFFSRKDPVSELVSALLSHRTRNAESARAYRRLRELLPTWEEVAAAPLAAVQEALSAATWPEQKAPRLQEVLRQVQARTGGTLDLGFLGDLPVAEARAWLEALPGVGPKTSAAVLLFSQLRRPALPVDSHHHRVAQRLGLLPAGMGPGPGHDWLSRLVPPDWEAQQVYDHHEAFMFHGQRCCYYAQPACPRCPVLDLCPYGQRQMGSSGPVAPGV